MTDAQQIIVDMGNAANSSLFGLKMTDAIIIELQGMENIEVIDDGAGYALYVSDTSNLRKGSHS